MDEISLQEGHARNSTCFGCELANGKGLHIRSFAEGDQVVAVWKPEPHHEAFPGAINGGIIEALLDCHSNWTSALNLMKKSGASHPPCTVTAEYHVKFFHPTPTDSPVKLIARVFELKTERAVIDAELISKGKVCATCRGTFVAVKPGHPAYHRW
ncbi:MAG: PaaI family thioesterase [Nitrospirota bacterium]